MTARFIHECVRALKKRHSGADACELAEQLGIKLRIMELGGLKGLYICYARSRYIILNSSLSSEERLMVAAHELGHDRLHRGMSADASFKDSLLFDAKGRAEFDANLFAAELLIEDESVSSQSEGDCYSLAMSLGVAPQLLLYKLYSMNCRGYAFPLPEECRTDFLRRA